MKILHRGTALLLSVAMVISLLAGGLLIQVIAETAFRWEDASLDDLSRFYETGNARSPGMISTVDGDAGGKSYGMYMFASNAGTPHNFAEWCKSSYPEGDTRHDIGVRLDEAYHHVSDGYGPYFDAAWEDVANVYGSTFASAQYEYTKATIYEPTVDRVSASVPAFQIDNYSVALKNVFWSRAVQHGSSGACSLILRAFDALGGFANQSESLLIQAIYAESGRLVTASQLSSETSGKTGPTMSGDTADKYGTTGLILRYFFGCSGDVQMGVYRRLAVNEPSDALVMLMNNGYYNAPAADGNYRLLCNSDQRLALDGSSGSPTIAAAASGGVGQVFTASYHAGGYYTFDLTVNGSTLRLSTDGSSVKLAKPSAGAEQLWTLEKSQSGYLLRAMTATGNTASYLSVKEGALVMAQENVSAWQLSPVVDSASDWGLSGVTYPSEKSILTAGRSSYPVRGIVSCAAPITSLNITILNSNGAATLAKTVKPNTTAYDLKQLDDAIAYSKLPAGSYTFTLTGTAEGKTVKLISSPFTVKANSGATHSDESFTVTFNAQGGTIRGVTTKQVTLDSIVYGDLPTAIREGAQFLGWFTADGEQIVDSTPVRAANLTLYARYAGMSTYTFLDAAGNKYVSGTAAEGELIPAPSVPPAKAPDSQYAYVFKGWDGYTAGETLMGDQDVSFTPLYNAVPLSEITDPSASGDNYWPGLLPGTTVEQLNKDVKVYDGETAVTSGKLGTGMTAVYGGKRYTLVITGDINGDGRISIIDVVAIQSHVVGKQTLTGAYEKAADLNGDGKISILDVVKAARVVVGKESLN